MVTVEVFRTPIFRLTAIFAGTFASCALLLFGFIYWQTSTQETAAVDQFLLNQSNVIARGKVLESVRVLTGDGAHAHGTRAVIALFGADGKKQAGTIDTLPPMFPIDGRIHDLGIAAGTSIGADAQMRAVAIRLPRGGILFVARDVSELGELRNALLRALRLGLLPLFLLSLAAGTFLSWRTLQRVKSLHLSIERILAGNLHERLPIRGTHDHFDALAGSVNRLLDEIERLLEQTRSIGNDIAHDLRTPLSRVRTRLERGRISVQNATRLTKASLEETLAAAISGLDQALAIITALLRISELEDSRRRAGFESIVLTGILDEVTEIYLPIAEEKGIAIAHCVWDGPPLMILGDRALLVEALANVIDNAIKFTRPSGTVRLSLDKQGDAARIKVSDDGPGIPAAEREAVLERFYRSDRSRHLPGSGLGLGLVAAIVKLHKFRIIIGGNERGCVFDILCAPVLPAAQYNDVNPRQ